MKVVCSTSNPNDLIEYLKDNKEQSFYFLDIDLGKHNINGFQLSKEIRKIDPRGFIVIITNHGEYAMNALKYQIEVMDYIIKDNFEYFAENIKKCLLYAYELYTTPNKNNTRIISIPTKTKNISMPIDKIYVIKSDIDNPHYIKVVGEDFTYSFYSSLNEIEKQLDNSFYRCIKSCIINMNHIVSIDKHEKNVNLTQNITVPISIRNYSKFVESYKQFLQSKK